MPSSSSLGNYEYGTGISSGGNQPLSSGRKTNTYTNQANNFNSLRQLGGSLEANFQANIKASVNLNSEFQNSKKVQISNAEAESKRLVLAFESHIQSEITWALNTLSIFSCNTN